MCNADSEDLDSLDCDLGGPLNASREGSPMGAISAVGSISAAAGPAQQPSRATTNDASTTSSSESSGRDPSGMGERPASASASASGNGDSRGELARLFELRVAAPPLSAHSSGLRCLTAGSAETLVSGDSNGDLCIWSCGLKHRATDS